MQFCGSTVPVSINFVTREKLSSSKFCVDEMAKIIRRLRIRPKYSSWSWSNFHIHDKTLYLLNIKTIISDYICFESESLPKEQKKENIIPVYKKGDKQLITNYWLLPLLPICRKINIFNSLFIYLNNINFLKSNQSRFRPGDSCVHQLLSITRDSYKALDVNP